MKTRWVIIGAGFAGASTAWALARAGLGPGIIVDQEPSFGVHASGRNAALIKVSESDPVIASLACRGLRSILSLESTPFELVRRVGGVTLGGEGRAHEFETLARRLGVAGLSAHVLSREQACRRLPLLERATFQSSLWCDDEGVADIHALLQRYLEGAREGGFLLRTRTRADELLVEDGRVTGIRAGTDTLLGDTVIDASGAWAGRLRGQSSALPLRTLRRHLFVSGALDFVRPDLPFVWMEDDALYFRPEGDGLLLSPCDESPMPPGIPPTDPEALELLADKLSRAVPSLADLAIRRSWACLRTFASDRRPLIGPDPDLAGLFHVSALGGFGVTCSAAIGELAADLLQERPVEWIDPVTVAPKRVLPRDRE